MWSKRKKITIRFSMAALLMLMAVAAGYFGGFRWGADDSARQRRSQEFYHQVYYIPDLIDEDAASFDQTAKELTELITSTVSFETWSVNGEGKGEIRPYPNNQSLVVSANQDTHEQLEDLLKQLRSIQLAIPGEELATCSRRVIASKPKSPQPLRAYQQRTLKNTKTINVQFSEAVQTLRDIYGKPTHINKKASEANFPDWATGNQIAVWPQRRGQLYLLVQDTEPTGIALAIGWRANGQDIDRLAISWPPSP